MYNYMNKWFTKIENGTFNNHWKNLSHSVGLPIVAMVVYEFKDNNGNYHSFARTKDNIDDIKNYDSMELINKFYITILHIGVWPFTEDDLIDEVCTIYGIGDFRYKFRENIGNFDEFIKDYDYKNVPFSDEEYIMKNTFIDEGKISELPF